MQYLRSFHSKSFTLSQQNQRSETTKQKRFHNKTKGLKQQNKSASTTRAKLLNAKTQSSSALKR